MSLTVSGERSARGRWVGVFTLVTALLGLQLALGTGSSPAFAHAELLETTPRGRRCARHRAGHGRVAIQRTRTGR